MLTQEIRRWPQKNTPLKRQAVLVVMGQGAGLYCISTQVEGIFLCQPIILKGAFMAITKVEVCLSEDDAVQVIRSMDRMQGVKEHRLNFQYPEHWFAPVTLSPFAQQIEQETISWMQGIGLIKDKKTLSLVRAMEPGFFAGFSYSMAPYDHALLFCKCVTMWLLWDDERVEIAKTYEEIEAPVKALYGDQIPTHQMNDPYVQGFKHLGDEHERLGASKHWRKRFAASMAEWGSHAIYEEVLRRNNESDDRRSLEEAIQLRALTTGFTPTTIPVEQIAGLELPDELLESEDYKSILDCAAKICLIVNDVVGVPKDICNDQIKSNVILYYMNANNVSLFDAYNLAIKIHDDAVNTYDKLVANLLKSFPPENRAGINNFFNLIRYLETGFGIWQEKCIRYQQSVAAQMNQSYRIAITRRLA
ncbi:hypothetical protein FEM41_17270 [Jejubacter calystegiae]|uniref:Terpene synthase n=1 Tax=Jejubacter calystegiae TaxID=2579935 RepID=A0A4P8YM49_9ENTR|nr:terpene synthase family protein [Jejubacter calystegiae]QCT21273.1 hypothetical protein FEM41_17270 [Jejubacter calystegiae]